MGSLKRRPAVSSPVLAEAGKGIALPHLEGFHGRAIQLLEVVPSHHEWTSGVLLHVKGSDLACSCYSLDPAAWFLTQAIWSSADKTKEPQRTVAEVACGIYLAHCEEDPEMVRSI